MKTKNYTNNKQFVYVADNGISFKSLNDIHENQRKKHEFNLIFSTFLVTSIQPRGNLYCLWSPRSFVVVSEVRRDKYFYLAVTLRSGFVRISQIVANLYRYSHNCRNITDVINKYSLKPILMIIVKLRLILTPMNFFIKLLVLRRPKKLFCMMLMFIYVFCNI